MNMEFPQWVRECLDRLEQAGYAAYAVGGCVRDACLGLTPHDYDLCTQALPEETCAVFQDRKLVLAGMKHGTVGVVTDQGVVEITTFRAEGSYGDNRHPDWVKFVPDVEADLARRDYTINAMAYSPTRGFADPFAGREDLQNRVLRTVGDSVTRYQEDALRILRGVRFAVRFSLQVEEETRKAMFSQRGLLQNLARERVMEELCKLLPLVDARDLKEFAPVLGAVIPELEPMVGFDQHSPHHAYDLFTHTALVTEHVPQDLILRWAALLHDTGKVTTFTRDENGRGHFKGHAQASAEIADRVLQELKAPTALRQQVDTLVEQHMTPLMPDKKLLRRRISRLGWENAQRLWYLQRADFCSKGIEDPGGLERFQQVREEMMEIQAENSCLSLHDLAVNGNDLMALGYRGKEIGACLESLLARVLDETLENHKEILLAAAKEEYKGKTE